MRVRFTSDSSVTYAGFVGNWHTGTCSLCPTGKYSWAGAWKCTNCKAGKYDSVTFISLCPAGQPLSLPPRARPHPSRVPWGDTRRHREELWVS
jgi:hypothetical protein